MNNLSSKQDPFGVATGAISGGDLPALDPSAVANYYGQLQTLQSTLMNSLASLRAERVGFRGEANVQRADVKQQGIQAIAEGVGQSMDRGTFGSSADYKQRIQGQAAIASGIADVNRNLHNQLSQNRYTAAGARLTAEQQAQQLAAGAISQRMSQQAQEAQNQIAIRSAMMQARASRLSSAAETRLANYQLQGDQQTAAALKQLANNPYASPWAQQLGLQDETAIRAAAIQSGYAASYGG
jgi:hypothetical protein